MASAPVADATAFKQNQREAWGAGAHNYAAQAHEGSGLTRPVVAEVARLVTQHLAGAAAPAVLDIGSANGEPGLSLAQALPGSTVTVTDLAPEMVALARQLGQQRGVTNARFEVADGEDLSQFGDAAFDALSACLCLLFMPQHKRALAEFRRVLKRGAPAVVAVWSLKAEELDLVALVKPAMASLLPAPPPPPPGEPSEPPIAAGAKYASAEELVQDFRDAGFGAVECRAFNVPMTILPGAACQAVARNPCMAQGLARAAAAGGLPLSDAEDRFLAEFERLAAEQGRLQPDGSVVLPTNVALVLVATA